MNTAISKEFIEQSIYRMDENSHRIIKCVGELDEDEIWKSPNDHSNSIGNLILHLCGNIRQYIISALGETEDKRRREEEFSTKKGFTKTELLNQLTEIIKSSEQVIKEIGESQLTKIYSVQGFNLTSIGIIIHVTEHYSYHTGQIAFWTKQLKNKDLRFYDGIDLNARNKNLT